MSLHDTARELDRKVLFSTFRINDEVSRKPMLR